MDYKTGDKTFDIKNVRLGLDMQMLLYLFSIWENGEARYGKTIYPAGVLYSGIKPPQIDKKAGESTDDFEADIKPSGLFLKDEAVLRAMEANLEKKYIPVEAKDLKEGARAKENLIGAAAFAQLKEQVSETVLKYAAELKKGIACAKPMASGGQLPCEYCKMKTVCRVAK